MPGRKRYQKGRNRRSPGNKQRHSPNKNDSQNQKNNSGGSGGGGNNNNRKGNSNSNRSKSSKSKTHHHNNPNAKKNNNNNANRKGKGGKGGGGGGGNTGGKGKNNDNNANDSPAMIKKREGNQAFQNEKFSLAIKLYTEAIDIDDTEHTLYSNRSAAYLLNKQFEEALADANTCIQLKPEWQKGYVRKGAALIKLSRLQEASECYQDGKEQCDQHDLLIVCVNLFVSVCVRCSVSLFS